VKEGHVESVIVKNIREGGWGVVTVMLLSLSSMVLVLLLLFFMFFKSCVELSSSFL
jgi:hypothetical protein